MASKSLKSLRSSKGPTPARLLEKALLQKKIYQQEAFMYQRLMEAIREGLPLEDVYKSIITIVTKGLGFDRAGLFLVREDGRAIERAMGIDWDGKFEGRGNEMPFSTVKGVHWFSDLVNGYAKWGFSNNIRSRVSAEVYQKDFGGKVICAAQVPIKVDKDKSIGVLAVDNLFTHRRLKQTDLNALLNFATQAGLAIQSFQLHERVTALTVMDPLTNVYNRRHFDYAFHEEVDRSERYDRPFGLLYADVDHFKSVNDRFGHAAGDEVLKRVALVLRQGVRNIDTVARIGGEEFAVILPETPPEGTTLVAERLVASLAESDLSKPVEKVTMSMGVACYPQSARNPEEVKHLADRSLYAAKDGGRNRVGPFLP